MNRRRQNRQRRVPGQQMPGQVFNNQQNQGIQIDEPQIQDREAIQKIQISKSKNKLKLLCPIHQCFLILQANGITLPPQQKDGWIFNYFNCFKKNHHAKTMYYHICGKPLEANVRQGGNRNQLTNYCNVRVCSDCKPGQINWYQNKRSNEEDNLQQLYNKSQIICPVHQQPLIADDIRNLKQTALGYFFVCYKQQHEKPSETQFYWKCDQLTLEGEQCEIKVCQVCSPIDWFYNKKIQDYGVSFQNFTQEKENQLQKKKIYCPIHLEELQITQNQIQQAYIVTFAPFTCYMDNHSSKEQHYWKCRQCQVSVCFKCHPVQPSQLEVFACPTHGGGNMLLANQSLGINLKRNWSQHYNCCFCFKNNVKDLLFYCQAKLCNFWVCQECILLKNKNLLKKKNQQKCILHHQQVQLCNDQNINQSKCFSCKKGIRQFMRYYCPFNVVFDPNQKINAEFFCQYQLCEECYPKQMYWFQNENNLWSIHYTEATKLSELLGYQMVKELMELIRGEKYF